MVATMSIFPLPLHPQEEQDQQARIHLQQHQNLNFRLSNKADIMQSVEKKNIGANEIGHESSKTKRRVHFHHTCEDVNIDNCEVEKMIIEYEVEWDGSDYHRLWYSSEELHEIEQQQADSLAAFVREKSKVREYCSSLIRLWQSSSSPSPTFEQESVMSLARFERGWDWAILYAMRNSEMSSRSALVRERDRRKGAALLPQRQKRSAVQNFIQGQERYHCANHGRMLSAKYARDSRQSVGFAKALALVDEIAYKTS